MSARVLVVEDDALVAAAVRRSLDYAGYAVSLAADGPAGLAAAIRDAPDLVVLDVNLPGLDGFGVCRALRASGVASLVLMLTARDATTDRVDGLDAGGHLRARRSGPVDRQRGIRVVRGRVAGVHPVAGAE